MTLRAEALLGRGVGGILNGFLSADLDSNLGFNSDPVTLHKTVPRSKHRCTRTSCCVWIIGVSYSGVVTQYQPWLVVVKGV